MFRERYGLKQQALFHILGAYSVYNAEIGTHIDIVVYWWQTLHHNSALEVL